MPLEPTLAAAQPVLRHYLHGLWGLAPRLAGWPEADGLTPPSLRPGEDDTTLWLPAQAPDARWYEASAAHAAAHLQHSRGGFDPRGVHPLTRALVGLLEDARVERLAARALPGLWVLWNERHSAGADSGGSLEALMARLARALHDPGYDDAHAWVRKGRAIFLSQVADGAGDAASLRLAASRLGHDIGQMRLRFDDRRYRPAPAYRDDHTCLWQAAALTAEPAPSREEHSAMEVPATAAASPASPAEAAHRYPEWDHRIGIYRPDWCHLREQPAGAADARSLRAWRDARQAWLTGLVRRSARSGVPRPSRRRLCRHADEIDLDAAIREAAQRHAGHTPEQRVHREREQRPVQAAWLIVIDLSASMADEGRLDLARQTACCLHDIAAASGRRCALQGFHSDGRERQHAVVLTSFEDSHREDTLLTRLAGLRAQGSTRLGVALRHACSRLMSLPAERRVVLLLSDGEPHDIDVHDPTHLLVDARRAVREARHSGVQVQGLAMGADAAPALRRVLGGRHVHTLRRAEDLQRWVTSMRHL